MNQTALKEPPFIRNPQSFGLLLPHDGYYSSYFE